MNRRRFLKTTALTGLGLMSGCRSYAPPGVTFKGWAYEPSLVRANLDLFEQQTGISVDFAAVSGNYHDKMVALFVGASPMECCYVRDDDFAEWVEAGWLRPCDDLQAADPESDVLLEDMFPYNLEAMTYNGKLYGLPYYTDFNIWIFNSYLLEQAGIETPARTLDELTEQAIRIKEQNIRTPDGDLMEYPIVLNFRQSVLGFSDWWTLNYASEVNLFDNALHPIFPDDTDRRAERILQWITDGIHKHKIISPSSLTSGLIRENIAAGRQAFALINKYDLEWVNNRQNSVVAEEALQREGISRAKQQHVKILKMSLVPGLEPEQNGTLGWTRMYSLTAHCREDRVQDAWQLMKFLGGRDASDTYYTARQWFQLRGLGFAYKSLLDDPDIISQTEQWGDMDIIKTQAQYVRSRENIKAPWFPDFNIYYQPEIQKILLKQQSPRDGLGKIADRCRALKKEWG